MAESLAGMDPSLSCADAAQFEAMIHAQLASQAQHSRARLRHNRVTEHTTDPIVAAQALHSAGALKNYKPDRVLAQTDLRNLSLVQLQALLKQQQSMAANVSLLRSLPDKGAKIHARVAEIQQHLAQRQAAQERQVAEVESMLQRVHMQDGQDDVSSEAGDMGAGVGAAAAAAGSGAGIVETAPPSPGGASVASESSRTSASSVASSFQHFVAAPGGPRPTGRHHAASSFGSAAAAAAGASAAAAASAGFGAAAAARPPPPSAGFAQWGRGGEQLARATDAAVINARLERERGGNIESKFRRAPPMAISAEEANRLLRDQARDWHASAAMRASQFAAAPPSFSGGAAAAAPRSSLDYNDDEDDEDDDFGSIGAGGGGGDDLEDEDLEDLEDGLDLESVGSAASSVAQQQPQQHQQRLHEQRVRSMEEEEEDDVEDVD